MESAERLLHGFIFASFSAILTIVEAVEAQPNSQLRLAGTAVFLALALFL